MRSWGAFILILSTLAGCNISKHIPQGEKLFTGSVIQLQEDSTLSGGDRDDLKEELSSLARPKPNKRILGFPFKLWLYYAVGEPKKDSGLRASIRRKFGELPVLASAKALTSNATIMSAHLQNKGYFRSSVQGSLVEEGYQAHAVYNVLVRPRYIIDSVAFLVDSTPIRKALDSASVRTLFKKKDPYDYSVVQAEQARISDLIRRRGFYYFQPDYLTILADTAVGDHKVRLFVALKPDMPLAAGLRYYIRNVYIYPNYTLTNAANDTNRREGYSPMRRFIVVDSARMYSPKLFRDVVSVRPGRLYNSRAQDLTLSRFINVGTFKFVRNRFEPAMKGDTAMLDVHYYLTPYPRQSSRIELAGTSKSNNLTGSQLTIGWRNRNVFRRAELLNINANLGIEWQIGGRSQGVTNYRYGGDATLSFPRLVVPFRVRYDRRQGLPKTNITLGYSLIVRQDLYNLNSFQTSYGFAWQRNQRVEHSFQPFNITYVNTFGFGYRFRELEADPNTSQQYLRNITAKQLILNTIYSLNFSSSPRTSSPYTYRVNFNAEAAGNAVSLFARDRDGDDTTRIFGVPYAQYVRFDIDTRHYVRVAPSLTWANRVFIGLGIPYGNSGQLPFVKQYFVGGSNSIRAFRPRALGPGTYTRVTDTQVPLIQDGGGDMRLEANTEVRASLNQYIKGALFLDAGNVWMYSDESTYGPGSKFSPAFLRQVAVGTGAGVRIDLSYFLLRFDLAFPIRKPWLPDGQRWVFDQIAFGSRTWRQQNLILNVAVGYPF